MNAGVCDYVWSGKEPIQFIYLFIYFCDIEGQHANAIA